MNVRHLPAVPWAVPITAAWLAIYWLYFVRGAGWPRSTGASRRAAARANSIREEAWAAALLAGILGLVGILLLQGVVSRLVTLPRQRDLDPTQFPLLSVFLWVVMSAIVAGIVEETAFRGYLQRPIEQCYGPAAAILITGVIFALAHFAHPEVGLVLLPYYVAVAAVYGSLAYLTDSTLPSMLLHAGGNMLSALDLFTRGRSEWELSPAQPKLVWETGPDAAFLASIIAFLVAAALAIWAFIALSRVARIQPAVEPGARPGVNEPC